MGSCQSMCKYYETSNPVTILPSDYSASCGIPNPPILPVTVFRKETSERLEIFEITIGSPPKNFTFTATAVYTPSSSTVTISDKPYGVLIYITHSSIFFGQDFEINVVLSEDSPLGQSFVNNDKYIVHLSSTCLYRGAAIVFERPTNGKLVFNSSTGLLNSSIQPNTNNELLNLPIQSTSINNCQNICDSIRIPQINITAQTTIDGSDINDAIFTVLDEFKYQGEQSTTHDNPITENTCMIRYINLDEVKETQFRQCCPYMVSVVRGKGKTFYDRILSIYNKLGEAKIGVSFMLFYQYLVLYGMAKYILSKLLYGDFDINYLLGKYNEKFLSDLGASRFCGFIEFFEDCESPVRGYNKYFKY